ncbi:glucokinase [Halodesulfovibrio marinisediminis]|uniref:Glucokinase n=1 Tax=Halodesulfovibrio marinisediminis DSM 17456 TaxID=1121457 RepID=A0A1N6ICV3_9BACT|nr:glucokinase [Halodesulfovibrio marinisediminis]SIO29819.1 glucokinase [Halodesulfovibrio marinisediminis DSM 17456]
MKRILAADIGGTNSRFATFTLRGETISHDRSIWLSTNAADSFEQLLEMLASSNFDLQPHKADAIVFGVAGPVLDGLQSDPPNIPWDINLTKIPKKLCCSNAILINDFLAQAYATFTPAFKDAMEVVAGNPVSTCPVGIIGAGTGLGKSLLVPDSTGKYTPVPSEGGHGVFPFTTKEEIEYAEFLRAKIGREKIIQEHVLSGSGLSYLFEFHTGEIAPSQKVVTHFADYPVVLEWFSKFYGRICQNFVFDTLALGGLYITGGIAAGNPVIVTHSEFKKSFYNTELHSNILSSVPIKLNENEEAGLWGAAQYGADHLMHKASPRPTMKG